MQLTYTEDRIFSLLQVAWLKVRRARIIKFDRRLRMSQTYCTLAETGVVEICLLGGFNAAILRRLQRLVCE